MMIYEQIRLRPKNIEIIKMAFKESFLPGDRLWVFGSRVNLAARGGDIDLYVETEESDLGKVFDMRGNFWVKLQDMLGEQKIDIVVHAKNNEILRIHKVALATGIQII